MIQKDGGVKTAQSADTYFQNLLLTDSNGVGPAGAYYITQLTPTGEAGQGMGRTT